jgi:REP element-mobilizing transposase RayT
MKSMPRPQRSDYPGAWHHVMNRGVARTKVFLDDADRQAFLDELREAMCQKSMEVHAYCLMGNHYHILLMSRDGKLSGAMQRFSSRYTHRFNRRHTRDGPLFRGRYTSVEIKTDAHLLQALRYIHLNPVNIKRTHSPEDWHWSSAAAFANDARTLSQRGQTHGSDPITEPASTERWFVTKKLLELFGSDPLPNYLEFIQAGIDERTALFYQNLTLGSDPWV